LFFWVCPPGCGQCDADAFDEVSAAVEVALEMVRAVTDGRVVVLSVGGRVVINVLCHHEIEFVAGVASVDVVGQRGEVSSATDLVRI